jgi:hypothetical protein
MSTKPIAPDEVASAKAKTIPDEVIEALTRENDDG